MHMHVCGSKGEGNDLSHTYHTYDTCDITLVNVPYMYMHVCGSKGEGNDLNHTYHTCDITLVN